MKWFSFPAARQDLPALRMVRSPDLPRLFAWAVALLFAVVAVALYAAPWQQTSFGSGTVIAHSPLDRQQGIEAPIEGRLVRWWVGEGSRVRAGDPVVELSDLDPAILERLAEERSAVVQRLEAAQARAAALEARADALGASRSAAIAAADDRSGMAMERIRAAERAVEAAAAAHHATVINLERQRGLAAEGLKATRAVELAEVEETRARTDLARAEAALAAARQEQRAIRADAQKAGTDGSASVEDARSARAAALAEAASARAELTRIEQRIAR